jgi:N-dimethylarginine dimethylaminohydrolase
MAQTAAPQTRRFGAQSMTTPLHQVLVKRPGQAFGRAHENPAHGFLHSVDLTEARRQHDAFCTVLAGLGVTVHQIEAEISSPDLVYTFDPALVTDRGVIALRSGKPTRRGEEKVVDVWAQAHDIPVLGGLEAPATADGGDTFWLRPDIFCIGRSLRTNDAGTRRLRELVGGDVHVFDVPYANGPAECLHLLSVISPISDDLAVVFLPQLPAGLHELLREHAVELMPVPEAELVTQGCNILAVRPGVVVMVEGNPVTQRALLDRGCEVHTFPGDEVCINGSGGPTCITRPILRG